MIDRLKLRFSIWYARKLDERSRHYPLAESVVMPWTADEWNEIVKEDAKGCE